MLAQCGVTVVRLHRERFGGLSANDLDAGSMRPLTREERASLVGLLPADRTGRTALPDALRRQRVCTIDAEASTAAGDVEEPRRDLRPRRE